MATDPGLERLQRWMQTCIVTPGPCEEVIESAEAQSAIPASEAIDVVLPSRTLSSFERLDIYRDMYLLRMEEALTSDYPALKHYLGDDGFMALVARYVDVYPSRSYTLNRLGDHFPEFIAFDAELSKREFCHDLARLEYALTMVFDEQETPVLTAEDIAAVPPEAWENVRLKPIAAFRLGAFDYPVSAYLGGVDKENPFPPLRKKKTWVVGYRKKYHVERLDLTKPAYELLSAIVEGKTLSEALAQVPKVTESQLFEWFRDWMADGLFQSLEIAAPQPA
jgi:hypothetical protein